MPNTTPNFALPYPAATDEPCDFAEQWCDFTAAIDDVFATFQAGIDRTIPTIPIAMLQQTVTRSILNFSPLLFDTVVIDTAGMTDLDSDLSRITIPRNGVYSLNAGMVFASPGVVNGPIFMAFNQDIFPGGLAVNVSSEALDRGPGLDYRLTANGPARFIEQGVKLGIYFDFGVATLYPIVSSWMSVSWHADSMVP